MNLQELNFKKQLLASLLVTGLTIIASTSAGAAIITESFTGTMAYVQDPTGNNSQLSSIIKSGDAFSGTFSYDSNWQPTDMTPYCGTTACSTYQLFLNSNVQQLNLTIGANTYSAGGLSGSNGQIGFNNYSINFFGLSGASTGSLTPAYATFSADGSTTPGSFVWPTNGFNNTSFTNQTISLSFFLPGCDAKGACYFSAVGSILPVPEPESYAMMLMGIGLMGFVARRRKIIQMYKV
jgi:hypothetical protein